MSLSGSLSLLAYISRHQLIDSNSLALNICIRIHTNIYINIIRSIITCFNTFLIWTPLYIFNWHTYLLINLQYIFKKILFKIKLIIIKKIIYYIIYIYNKIIIMYLYLYITIKNNVHFLFLIRSKLLKITLFVFCPFFCFWLPLSLLLQQQEKLLLLLMMIMMILM